ncbi:MAG: hypothetical protein LBC31_01785 [Treponema sp.]|jgi:hypothetical protein|nr:hypothetical protein [Treponema sp.]
MRKTAAVIVLSLVFTLSVVAQYPTEETFGWRLSVTDGAGRFLDFTRTLNLERNNSITIAIKSEKDCYCYLVQRGENANITILFDGPLPAQRERFFYPATSFRLGTFYVVMALSRLEDLEGPIADYRKDPASPVKANALYDAVLAVQTRVNSTARPVVEFTTIGGATTRGQKMETGFYGVRYSESGIYARTIIVRY